MIVPAGSAAETLRAAMGQLPAGLRLAEVYGDVDVVLVYDSRADGLPEQAGEASPEQQAGVLQPEDDGLDSQEADEGSGRRWMSEAERVAYEAGRADVLALLRRQLTRGRRVRGAIAG